jgi:peptidoglycan/LPS O-acetylase OafA/YrhL
MSAWSDKRSLREAISGHDNNYTLLRAFLAASVIYFHSFGLTFDQHPDCLSEWLMPISNVGNLAVQSFFFLSGLFVTQSFFNDPNTLRFVLRRFFRIWPGFFVCLVVTVFLLCALSSPKNFVLYTLFNDVYEYIVRNAAFQLTWFVPGVFPDHAMQAINGPIHTLPMEAKMYVILAIAGVVGMLSTPLRIGVAGFAIALACLLIGDDVPGVTWFFAAPYARPASAMFFAGVMAFAAARWIYPRWWQGVALAAVTALTHGNAHSVAFFLTVAWAIVFLGQLPLLAKLGRPKQDLSYGIYIYGWPCQQFVVSLTSTHLNPYALTPLALALSCGFAALSWRYIEKPAIMLGHLLPVVTMRSIRRQSPVLSFVERRAARLGGVLFVVLVICVSMRSVTVAHDFVSVVAMPVQIVDYGPKEGRKGVAFNAQPDGSSAMWFKLDGVPPQGTSIYMSGRKLDTDLSPGLATARVPAELIASAGDRKLYLERRSVSVIDRSKTVDLRIGE